jgi:hypothetical protein
MSTVSATAAAGPTIPRTRPPPEAAPKAWLFRRYRRRALRADDMNHDGTGGFNDARRSRHGLQRGQNGGFTPLFSARGSWSSRCLQTSHEPVIGDSPLSEREAMWPRTARRPEKAESPLTLEGVAGPKNT